MGGHYCSGAGAWVLSNVFSFGAHTPSNCGALLSERMPMKWQLALRKVLSSSSLKRQTNLQSQATGKTHHTGFFPSTSKAMTHLLQDPSIPLLLFSPQPWMAAGYPLAWKVLACGPGQLASWVLFFSVLFAFFFPSLQMSKGGLVWNFKPHCDHHWGGMLYPLGQLGWIHGKGWKQKENWWLR